MAQFFLKDTPHIICTINLFLFSFLYMTLKNLFYTSTKLEETRTLHSIFLPHAIFADIFYMMKKYMHKTYILYKKIRKEEIIINK